MNIVKTTMLAAGLLMASFQVRAAANAIEEDWQNPEVFEINRLPMRASFTTDQQKTLSLNGEWKFNFCENPSSRTVGFQAVDFNDSGWDNIPVPGLWDFYGYCDPMYVNVGYPWRGHYRNNPPFVPEEHNYVGQYRRTFIVEEGWTGRQICLCIGSATSNVRVWVNGKEVGYSEDSKLEARFDITRYVKAGVNTIALEIFRWCDGTYLEDQDFWRFAGIARGVYVYTREQKRIEDINVRADMNGNISILAKTTPGISRIKYAVYDSFGNIVAEISEPAVKSQEKDDEGNLVFRTDMKVNSPALWSAESPSLYTLRAEAEDRKGVVESTGIDFGFRSVEIRNSQLLVNGQPVLIKGADRHELSPYGGYVISEAEMIRDIEVMKQLNVNAVRTCHYPDDPRWYSLCDKYGIYVLDEANIESHGMGYGKESLAHRADYNAAHLIRNQRMVYRDINHPSIIIWSLGNEAGNGDNFRAAYDWIKGYDPTRPVQYERAVLEYNTDIYCPMYLSPDGCEKYLTSNPPKPLIQCEYAHAMGNSVGNFKEYWDLVRKYPSYQGGFIWDFEDQAIRKSVDPVRYGTDHMFIFGGDSNDYDPSDGSFNCNGFITADRQFHPSAYEIRYQYRSILTSLEIQEPKERLRDDNTEIRLNVHNENFFIDLSRYRLVWTVEVAGNKVRTGVVENVDAAPGETVSVGLGITGKDLLEDAVTSMAGDPYHASVVPGGIDGDIYITASWQLKKRDSLLPAGFEVAYDQMALYGAPASAYAAGSAAGNAMAVASVGDNLEFTGTYKAPGTTAERNVAWKAVFDKTTGLLTSYENAGVQMLKEPLMPSFWRAPVENDMGADMHKKFRMWRNPELKPVSMDVAESEGYTCLTVVYRPFGDVCDIEMTYRVYGDGAISCTEKLKDAGSLSKATPMFRFGMKFTMPGEFSTLDFYGYGPWENYSDRCSAALMGRYVQSVSDQYHYGYPRTQESGTKTGLRWMRVLDASGKGIEITSDVRFSGSAIPFSIDDLDCTVIDPNPRPNPTNNQKGIAKHSLELIPLAHKDARALGSTYVNFELKQMGVGGINSWGTWPLEAYRVNAEEMEFNFVIRPL